MTESCLFCKIIAREIPAQIVFEDESAMAFLDTKPVFPGHVLLIPKQHLITLTDVPPDLIAPLFRNAQLLTRAVERAMEAPGSFVAINNRVSQSVPHLHIHIVPRRPKDGLRGFFWPRTRYDSPAHFEETAEKIRRSIQSA
jgi:histidine triad (HIT) family protein